MTLRKLIPSLVALAAVGLTNLNAVVWAQSEGAPPAVKQSTQKVTGEDIIDALLEGNVYIHPQVAKQFDKAVLEQAIKETGKTIKVAVVLNTGNFPSGIVMADELRKQLALNEDDVVLIMTPKGLSGASGRLSPQQIDSAFTKGGVGATIRKHDPTLTLATAIRAVGGTVTQDKRNDANRTGLIIFFVLAAVGGVLGVAALKKKREMDGAKGPIESLRQEVLKNLSYVDGYLDLLPDSPEAKSAKSLRASAYERYATVTGMLQQAKRPEELRSAEKTLQDALAELEECRKDIDRATGGTGVAMAAPDMPSLATDATKARLKRVEDIRSEAERDKMQREVDAIPDNDRGVSFFSGQPVRQSELVPVTMVINGDKRQVWATREEAEQIQRGETPEVRTFRDERGQYIPWYESRRYDPYRDYYGGWGMLDTLIATSAMVNLFSLTGALGHGMYGGGWHHGYGAPVVVNNNYGYDSGYGYGGNENGGGGWFGGGGGNDSPQYDPTPDHAGSMDFFGHGGYDESSSSGNFGADSNDSGGFFGPDDSSGFDFGGSDFGGDSGGFDGGDFGGGDW